MLAAAMPGKLATSAYDPNWTADLTPPARFLGEQCRSAHGSAIVVLECREMNGQART